MMLPELLNSYNLFLSYASLTKEDNEKFIIHQDDVLKLSCSVLLHLIRIDQLNVECVNEFSLFEDQLNIKDNKIVYSSMSFGFLLNEISPLLSTLGILQKHILTTISIMESKPLPSSMHDYFKKFQSYQISKEAKGILNKFWHLTGNNVRLYRDVDQHFNSLTDRYFMQILPCKRILVQFPDNPEEKSINKFKYEKDINGIDFLNEAFKEIHSTFEALAILYGAKPSHHRLFISTKQLGDVVPYQDRTLAFLYEQNVTQVENNMKMHISGVGIDQVSNGGLSTRKYYLDENKIKIINDRLRNNSI